MKKVLIPLSCCYEGDMLAEDVNNEKGVTLVAKNTAINQFIIQRLQELQIYSVWVYQSPVLVTDSEYKAKYKELKSDYFEAVLLVKQLINDLSLGGSVDYEAIKKIASIVNKNVNESGHITKYLIEIKSADEYTYTHCLNVAFYSMLIAKWLGLSGACIVEAIQAGLLHDIGKVRIPDEILNKKGKLSPEEYEEIKNHSRYGYEMIETVPELSDRVKYAVLAHHERIDGSGYPSGLLGDSIELYARIVAVADVYDAMTQNRVYKKKVSPFETFQMFLTIGIGTFDTTVLRAFLRNLSAFYVGTNVQLSNGDIGQVVYVPPQDIVYPVISVGSNYIDMSVEKDLKVINII